VLLVRLGVLLSSTALIVLISRFQMLAFTAAFCLLCCVKVDYEID